MTNQFRSCKYFIAWVVLSFWIFPWAVYGSQNCDRMLSHAKNSIADEIHSLYEVGLQREDIIGLHGTSLEALKIALNTGVLPTGDAGVRDRRGGIYIAEISSRIPKEKVRTPKRYDFTFAFELAADMARLKSDMFSLGRALNIPFDPLFFKDFDTLVDSYEQRDYDVDAARVTSLVLDKLKITESDLEEAVQAARKDRHRGIILALGKSVFDDPTLEVIDSYPDQGFLIRPRRTATAPLGIPLRHFTGLKALGAPETTFLENL